jgi:hypothetical protein
LLDVFSHTIPGPPPGARVLAAAFDVEEAVFAVVAAAAGAAAAVVFAALVAAAGASAVVVVAALVAAAGAGAAVGADAYHSFTPWCPRQAPCLLAAVE